MHKALSLCLLAALAPFVVSCKAESKAPPTKAAQPAEPAGHAAHLTPDHFHEFHVACGCALDKKLSGGKCSEWVEIEGKYLPLELPAEIKAAMDKPTMPFCGMSKAKAKIKGEIKMGKAVATAFEFIKG